MINKLIFSPAKKVVLIISLFSTSAAFASPEVAPLVSLDFSGSQQSATALTLGVKAQFDDLPNVGTLILGLSGTVPISGSSSNSSSSDASTVPVTIISSNQALTTWTLNPTADIWTSFNDLGVAVSFGESQYKYYPDGTTLNKVERWPVTLEIHERYGIAMTPFMQPQLIIKYGATWSAFPAVELITTNGSGQMVTKSIVEGLPSQSPILSATFSLPIQVGDIIAIAAATNWLFTAPSSNSTEWQSPIGSGTSGNADVEAWFYYYQIKPNLIRIGIAPFIEFHVYGDTGSTNPLFGIIASVRTGLKNDYLNY